MKKLKKFIVEFVENAKAPAFFSATAGLGACAAAVGTGAAFLLSGGTLTPVVMLVASAIGATCGFTGGAVGYTVGGIVDNMRQDMRLQEPGTDIYARSFATVLAGVGSVLAFGGCFALSGVVSARLHAFNDKGVSETFNRVAIVQPEQVAPAPVKQVYVPKI